MMLFPTVFSLLLSAKVGEYVNKMDVAESDDQVFIQSSHGLNVLSSMRATVLLFVRLHRNQRLFVC